MKTTLGSASRGAFRTYRTSYVNGVLTESLIDASVTQLTFKLDGADVEDTLTLGGTDPRDSQLSRVGVGTFEWWFAWTTAGTWRVVPRYTDVIGAASVQIKGPPFLVTVTADPCAWTDRPAL